MGVFSRFRRASKEAGRSSEESPAEKATAADPVTAEPASGTVAAQDTAEAVRSEEETVASEGAGIPKQLSVEESADSDAGESART
ncbi:hypothetical protein [Streptomyces coffeae]|uniref:Gliding motility protein n=1 Tax=Streptomyces coffeae TaxID=621382 RepID=A0ABS1NK71_9ACTN|nr:hypothetical protein [Streptomyces coffeae]MBL1100419.1 hypothetical protein [Streptomyces coffeae]